jgi:hypothetical protein
MKASMTFSDWTHLHLRASLTTRRYFRAEPFQPMLVIRTSADQDVVGILAVPKSQVQAAIQTALAAYPGARAIALVLDTWIGEPRSTPIPRGVRVRDLPGTMDAMVAIGMLPDGTTGGWMARYLLIDGEVVFEPETPVAEDMPVVSPLLPAPWEGRDHV